MVSIHMTGTIVRRNAFEISDTRWSYDSERLISSLQKILNEPVSNRIRETNAARTQHDGRKLGSHHLTKALIAAGSGFIASLLTGLIKAGFPFRDRWYYDDFWEFGFWLMLWPIFGVIAWLVVARMARVRNCWCAEESQG
jgi:hypothetical protein